MGLTGSMDRLYNIGKKSHTEHSFLDVFVDMGDVRFGNRLQCWFCEGISIPPGTGLIDVASVFLK